MPTTSVLGILAGRLLDLHTLLGALPHPCMERVDCIRLVVLLQTRIGAIEQKTKS
jgi:hypothetical protein